MVFLVIRLSVVGWFFVIKIWIEEERWILSKYVVVFIFNEFGFLYFRIDFGDFKFVYSFFVVFLL